MDEVTALRALPQVQKLLDAEAARPLLAEHGHGPVVAAIRAHLARLREELRQGGTADLAPDRLLADIAAGLARRQRPALRRTLNLTGIVLHTNLGRAPLAPAAVTAMVEVARGYASLELDLDTGRRGSRNGAVEELLCALTGAEAALAVNNNAAAILLALGGIAAGGEVIVSRGELVEIGGSFRIPDVVRQSGAVLVEVGTTNRTRLADYERAITPATRAILKVHQSNYRIVGFTAAVSLAELAPLAGSRGIPLVDDQGSGTLADLTAFGLPPEPTLRESIAAGADLVTASGDKLLGGPQAGLILGRRAQVDRLRAHPLLRAVRLDKLRLAALEATLRLHAHADGRPPELPVLAMLGRSLAELEADAETLRAELAALDGLDPTVVESTGYAGGGALPQAAIPSRAVAVRPLALTIEELARRLRAGNPALIGRISRDRLLLDLRTLQPGELPEVVAAFKGALACAG